MPCAPDNSTVSKHSVPIGQMGNYQEHLKRINPLREVDTGAVRTQLFGNPFKLEKAADKVSREEADTEREEMASVCACMWVWWVGGARRKRKISPNNVLDWRFLYVLMFGVLLKYRYIL